MFMVTVMITTIIRLLFFAPSSTGHTNQETKPTGVLSPLALSPVECQGCIGGVLTSNCHIRRLSNHHHHAESPSTASNMKLFDACTLYKASFVSSGSPRPGVERQVMLFLLSFAVGPTAALWDYIKGGGPSTS